MADKSAIEWTDATWNPIRARNIKTGKVGWHCEHATTGCEWCYAEGFNKRLGTGLAFKPGHRKDIEIFLDEAMLTQPLRWKKPRKIFVGSMTDLFADFVPTGWIERIFAVMDLTPQHTYQVLTKRAARMRQVIGDPTLPERLLCEQGRWPLPNVWLGVSAERQQEADERIPLLLQTPAAIRFISAEPLLGPIDFIGALARWQDDPETARARREGRSVMRLGTQLINWVIAGGESGPNARPMHPEWARSLRDQCAAAGIAFFFKQWGEWTSGENVQRKRGTVDTAVWWGDDWFFDRENLANTEGHRDDEPDLYRVGKLAAGRMLDGELHNAMPEVTR